MSKYIVLIFSFFFLCAFSDLKDRSNEMKVESNSPDWEVSMRGNSSVRAYDPKAELELIIDISNLLPSSVACVSNKRIKDIKFSINVYKIAQAGDSNWAKAFERTRILFRSRSGTTEKKLYGSNFVKNNLNFSPGTFVNIGRMDFLAPYVCEDINGLNMRLTGMKGMAVPIPPLDLTIKTSD